ncbi:MobA/MobL family protein [Alteripontixanthobacter maritimus]|uniref:MobA/MobL family protein n=1 Tax=Alteripontixanthobacter maritimus TaxID=2161824 RepID=UPI001E34D000|nr:MobA/MobL family protein [Alteripontixanthobacter maritimus]
MDADRLSLREIWDVPDHIKSVKQLEREAAALQREREFEWRKFKVHASFSALNPKVEQRSGSSTRAMRVAKSPPLLPAYSIALRDGDGRLFPFMRTSYSSAAISKSGRGRRLVIYQTDGAYILDDGSLAVFSNVGKTPEEMAEAFDQIEKVNRSAAKNAKIVHHMIIQSLHELSPEEQLAMAKRYCEQTFAAQGLPYVLAMHAPDPDGDSRNWHFHIAFSYRPVERTGQGDWIIDRCLRTDLDNPEGWKQMRYLLAEQFNYTCERHGLAKRFTHLSYAASGLDYIPQQHMGPGLTAKVRRGETVAVNAENHRRVAQNEYRRAARELKIALLAQVSAYRQLTAKKLAAAVAASRPLVRPMAKLSGFTMPAALQTAIKSSAGVANDNDRQTSCADRSELITKLTLPPQAPGSIAKRPPIKKKRTIAFGIPPRPLKRSGYANSPAKLSLRMTVLPQKLGGLSDDVRTALFDFWIPTLPTPLEPMTPDILSGHVNLRPVRLPEPLANGVGDSLFSPTRRFVISSTLPTPLAFSAVSDNASTRATFTVSMTLPAQLKADAAFVSPAIHSQQPDASALDLFPAPRPRLSDEEDENRQEERLKSPPTQGEDTTGPQRDAKAALDRLDREPAKSKSKVTSKDEAPPKQNILASLDRLDLPSTAIDRNIAKPETSKPLRDKFKDDSAATRGVGDNAVGTTPENSTVDTGSGQPQRDPPSKVPTGYRLNSNGKLVIDIGPTKEASMGVRSVKEDRVTEDEVRHRVEEMKRNAHEARPQAILPDEMLASTPNEDRRYEPLRKGINSKIDRWIDADTANDREARHKAAAAIRTDRALIVRINSFDPTVRARFQRDWETIDAMRPRDGRGERGRAIDDE